MKISKKDLKKLVRSEVKREIAKRERSKRKWHERKKERRILDSSSRWHIP